MIKYKCLVLDHDDTVVQSETTVNYPCFCRFLEQYRPGTTLSLEEYISDCCQMTFIEMCKTRFSLTEEELHQEYLFWKDYLKTHSPDAFPGIRELLHAYQKAGGIICVSSMSSEDNIRRDYLNHFGLEADAVFGWDLPEEKHKPNPYALEEIKRRYHLSADDILVVDDMKFAVEMARSAGTPIAFAGWGRKAFPNICQEMEKLCDFSFYSTEEFKNFLFV